MSYSTLYILRVATGAYETRPAMGTRAVSLAGIHCGPGATGEVEPVARELSAVMGVFEPFQTGTTFDGRYRNSAR